MKSSKTLRCPYPFFGGKSKAATLVWQALGNIDNYIEPFCGSAAVLLMRPHPPKVETLNDADCFVSNFWRATKYDPEGVVEWCDYPVHEDTLHAVHRWLVLGDHAEEFHKRMREDPDYFDVKVAGRWCWGLCCWIGSGWCRDSEVTGQLRKLSSQDKILSQQIPLIGDEPLGVHRLSHQKLSEQVPLKRGTCSGSHGAGVNVDGRPQLADAYARGRGVHGNDSAGTCEQRRLWLLDWFAKLRDRLRSVRICCGDWLRVCDSDSVTIRLGTTGIFLDPPYSKEADRTENLYGVDSLDVAADVRKYCLDRGGNKMYHIVLAGYAGEGHEELEKHGWEVVKWKSAGGYGNRSKKGKENTRKERLWLSPHCQKQSRGFF